MSERAAYSRVYWSIVDDPKFAAIYDDDHHLAAWMRLLLVADQSHPASAHVPAGCRRASVRALIDAGLVDMVTGTTYRIHGLDAERSRRRLAATRDRLGDQPGPNRDPAGERPARAKSPDTGPKDEDEVKDEDKGVHGLNGENSAPRALRPVHPVTA